MFFEDGGQLRLDDGFDHRLLLAVLRNDVIYVERVATVGAAVVGGAVHFSARRAYRRTDLAALCGVGLFVG